jgi:hypothetical protein
MTRLQISFGWLAGLILIAGAAALTVKVTEGASRNELWLSLSAFVPGATLGLLLIATAERLRDDRRQYMPWAAWAGALSIAASMALTVRVIDGGGRGIAISRNYPVEPLWAAITVLVWTIPVALGGLLLLQASPPSRRLGSPARWAVAFGLSVLVVSVCLGLKWAFDRAGLTGYSDVGPDHSLGDVWWFLNNAVVPAGMGLLLATAARPKHLVGRMRYLPMVAAALLTVAAVLLGFEIADQARTEKILSFFFGSILPLELALLILLVAVPMRLALSAGLVLGTLVVNIALAERILTQSGGEIGRVWIFLIIMLQPAGFAALCVMCLPVNRAVRPHFLPPQDENANVAIE